MWNRRPKPGEDEDDLLKMQEEYLREKNNNQDLKPSAQVTNLRCIKEVPIKRALTPDSKAKKPSKYAQEKRLKSSQPEERIVSSTSAVIGDILEKNLDQSTVENEPEFDDDKVYFPKVLPSLLGSIIEKNTDNICDFVQTPMPSTGFPSVTKHDKNVSREKKSIFAQNVAKAKTTKITQMEVDRPSSSTSLCNTKEIVDEQINIPNKSFVLSTSDATEIHNENVSVLKKMTEKDILNEQQKLLVSLDPKVIEFLKAKRKKHKNIEQNKQQNSNETDMNEPKIEDSDETMWDNDVLSHPHVDKWLHFDSLERDKLEWMKGIEESKKIKADEPYEARFDFKGYLLPYTIEYTEQNKTLFHHGEESHRPGYSFTELFELTRSAITQQRVMALNTIAGILDYFSAGTYKDIIDIPLSKILFILRIAMDANKLIILEPALKAMRNLVYNKIDEASLDALLGFEKGNTQPCLENDKSEIFELESKEAELKDFHLAEIDIISALIRTDIIQRIYYILDTIRPSFNSVQYCLQLLIRLSRDSLETAQKIVQCEHLMNAIIKNFVTVTSINFLFKPDVVYNGKPVLAALKLLRVLSLQSKEIGIILISKYDILTPISEYISSGVDGTYGLRIQIEAFCILSNLLAFGNGFEKAMSLCPVVLKSLYLHVQGTDIFFNSSVISATHAAVVFQLVNRVLHFKEDLSRFKHQVYPLLMEGVKKWLGQLSIAVDYTCAHLRLICSVLDCCKTILRLEQVPLNVLNNPLKSFASSKGYTTLIEQLIPSSNILSGIEKGNLHVVKNLMSLGTSVMDRTHKILPLLTILSPLPFLCSLFNLLQYVDDTAISTSFVAKLEEYLKQLSVKSPSLTDNWFTRIETDVIYSIVRVAMKINLDEANKDLLYTIANKLCYILRSDKKCELEFLFNNILFNKDWFTAERLVNLMSLSEVEGHSAALTNIEDIKHCYSKVLHLNECDTGPNFVLNKWEEPILPRDWIYLPILDLYSRSQDIEAPKAPSWPPVQAVPTLDVKDKEFIINSSLQWILFNEICFPDLLKDIDITDRFCRLMCVYLCDSSLFLQSNIKMLLHNCIQTIFKKEKKTMFNFNKQLVGLHNFQDFYTQFLEQFQSVSYGDSSFAACVLVPLAQRHDVKWRKLLWSEYAGCLRALDCPEDQLCYEMKDYLHPEETDCSLIKSYVQALSSNLLRPGTIVFKIASHHAKCYKERKVVNH